jgi:hypothetical protein
MGKVPCGALAGGPHHPRQQSEAVPVTLQWREELPKVWSVCPLMGFAVPVAAFAGDELAEALAAFQREAQRCKASAARQVSVELESIPGKPPSEPATPEELARVKSFLAKSGLPFDLREHRAAYEFTLALIRAKSVAVFSVSSTDPKEDLAGVRDCLSRLSSGVGLEYRYEQ